VTVDGGRCVVHVHGTLPNGKSVNPVPLVAAQVLAHTYTKNGRFSVAVGHASGGSKPIEVGHLSGGSL